MGGTKLTTGEDMTLASLAVEVQDPFLVLQSHERGRFTGS